MGVWLGPIAVNGEGKEPIFIITKNGAPAVEDEDYKYKSTTTDNVIYWELALLTSCTLRFKRIGKVDLFLVGAGYNGEEGQHIFLDGDISTGGAGGQGGNIYQVETGIELQRNSNLNITIGMANGNASSIISNTNAYSSANGASISEGGTGAISKSAGRTNANTNSNKMSGIFPWDKGNTPSAIFPTIKFGAAGGGGGAYVTGITTSPGSGGDTGGGDGGNESDGGTTSHKNGYDAQPNMGAGGGGGGASSKDGGSGVGGLGGSGIILIRNHRAH